jgi:HTH-type transcriptional regulator / antitoxin HigA
MPNTAKNSEKRGWALNDKELKLIEAASPVLKKVLPSVQNEDEYDNAVQILDYLIDITHGREDHPYTPLLHALGSLVSKYDEQVCRIDTSQTTPQEMVRFLMDQHGLKQKDLVKEFGSQSLISEFLHGKRKLTVAQLTALTKRFSINPSVFLET